MPIIQHLGTAIDSGGSGGGGGGGIVTTNLVLHLDASNSSSYSGSGTTWTDLSGQNNNGTLENGVSYSSSDGGYLVFDGNNDFISFTDSTDFQLGTGDFTSESWIQITGTFMRLGSFINDSDTQASPNFSVKQNEIYCYSNITNVYLLRKTIVSNTNTWYHVVFTRVGTDLKLYRDGVLIDSASNISTNFVDDRLVIGRNHSGSTYGTGHMSQSRLYKGKGLTASEVLQNYNATKSNYTIVTTDLILHLDTTNSSSYSGSGTAWNDLSGQGNHATLVNSPAFFTSNGGYLSFDGSNDYATLPNMDLTGNEITFSIWTLAQSNTSASLIFLGDSTASSGNGRILNVHLPHTSAGGRYFFDKGYDGSSYDRLYGSLANSDWQSAWVNWVFTANASTGSMKIYRNASLYASGTGYTKTFSNSDGDMKYIGYSGDNYYHGDISKILLYKKELSASEVLQNYNVDKSTYGH